MSRQSLSEEVITKIFELYLNDKSFQEISAEVGVSCATVKKYIKMGELDTIKAEMRAKEETKKKPAEKKSSSRKKQVNKKQSETNKKDTVAKQTKSRKEEPMASTVKSSKNEESKTISQKLLDTTSIQARLRRSKNTKVGILMPRSFESCLMKNIASSLFSLTNCVIVSIGIVQIVEGSKAAAAVTKFPPPKYARYAKYSTGLSTRIIWLRPPTPSLKIFTLPDKRAMRCEGVSPSK